MIKEGAQRKVTIFLVTLVSLCSFSFSCYASEFYDPELWDYNDTYVNGESEEDRKLIFFPLAPESQFHNYMIFYAPSDGYYYLYLSDGYLNKYYIFNNRMIVNINPWDTYRYKKGVSNNWELVHHETGEGYSYYNYRYPGMIVIDSTLDVQNYSTGQPIGAAGLQIKSGYRIYWQLSLILKMVLYRLSTVSNYVLQYELLRYAVLLGFAGEILFFVFILIRRLGDLKDAQTE